MELVLAFLKTLFVLYCFVKFPQITTYILSQSVSPLPTNNYSFFYKASIHNEAIQQYTLTISIKYVLPTGLHKDGFRSGHHLWLKNCSLKSIQLADVTKSSLRPFGTTRRLSQYSFPKLAGQML